jgi:hypothetical protein
MKAIKVMIQYGINVYEYEYPSISVAKRILKTTSDEEKAIAIKHAIKRQSALNRYINKNALRLSADEYIKGIDSIIQKYGMIDYKE